MNDTSPNTSGYVYILVNPAIPNLVKIGRTIGSPSSRAKEISRGTGVPAEFEVAWACEVADCYAVERLLHAELSAHRYRTNREFFEIAVEQAVRVCSDLCEPFRKVTISGAASDSRTVPSVTTNATQPKPARSEAPRADGREQQTHSTALLRAEGLVAASEIDLDKLTRNAGPTVAAQVREYVRMVLEVCPEILVKVRNDGKAIFVPPDLAHRAKDKNLTTINPGKGVFYLRIIDDLDRMRETKGEHYHPSLLESYRVRLANLLAQLRKVRR